MFWVFTKRNFNSIKVQLKHFGLKFLRVSHEHFNSIKVQLKHKFR